MANSMAALSRRLSRSFLSNPKISQFSMPFCTDNMSSRENYGSEDSDINWDIDSVPTATPQSSSTTTEAAAASQGSSEERVFFQRPLENGLDVGVYKAIIVGQVGQNPFQKRLKSGKTVTLLSVGTGGIRNNRRPLPNEEPGEYANRSAVQWHRVSVYPERLGSVVMKNVVPGSILYLEGNLESKVFTDPVTGIVRRIREIAIRQKGRVVFLGKGGDDQKAGAFPSKGVGYY
ncbi:hypothetical protein JCGZ_05840 [Jatropha curcas]|uniref:Single-stranded DNA-binding protein n=1 Tax=Jatropha curcas TaxID=180498 RepID=A0A067J8I3_JATCU|nr:single-stranded DNA-binding protein, mitochondrial [Jatropha curcas]KDP20071.1 hypothetical protein JCGZ_05840 [Jatropha curcas]